jgi:nucleobase:cation symporter-1, NCS1 family
LLGAGLLAWTARIGCDSGLSSAGLMHQVYGPSLARLPVLLNIVQLIGWTSFELVVMRDGSAAILQQTWGLDPTAPLTLALSTLLWGAVLAALMAGSMLGLVRGFISRWGLPLVVLSLLWLSWHFVGVAQAKGWESIWNRPGAGGMSPINALDLVVAMPVSWLPLVADYARHGRSGRSTLGGTWLGYALANVWCYALGVLVASVVEPGTDLVTALLLAQGGLLALGLILLDELDNAYGDVYSGALSAHSLRPQTPLKRFGLWGAALCTALAMALPMHSLEPFLLMLSSVFVPLFGVIIGRLGLGGGTAPSSPSGVNLGATALWLAGIGLYHALATWAPTWGSALPTLAVTLLLGYWTRPMAPLKAL